MSFDVPSDDYDQFMGRYSEPLAARFGAWLRLRPGQAVLDVGCGPGALTAVLARTVGANQVSAIDPAESFAAAVRRRLPGTDVRVGAAETLPWPGGRFDAAVAQLVVHLMADARAGLAEMARVTRPGGTVAATVWDFENAAAPASLLWQAAATLDPSVTDETGNPGTREGQLPALLHDAGLSDIKSTVLEVTVSFASFDDYWHPFTLGVGPPGAYLAARSDEQRAAIRAACARLLPDGPFTLTARSWTARGVATGRP